MPENGIVFQVKVVPCKADISFLCIGGICSAQFSPSICTSVLICDEILTARGLCGRQDFCRKGWTSFSLIAGPQASPLGEVSQNNSSTTVNLQAGTQKNWDFSVVVVLRVQRPFPGSSGDEKGVLMRLFCSCTSSFSGCLQLPVVLARVHVRLVLNVLLINFCFAI